MKFLFFLLTLLPLPAYSQLYHAQYTAQLATGDGVHRSGPTSLYFNFDTSMFVYHNVPKEDVFSVDGTVATSLTGDKSGLPIITYIREGKQIYKEPYSSVGIMTIFEEPIPNIKWTITPSDSQQQSLTLQHATGWYGNREYDVYFSPDIPFSYGPHRFSGLPGLIISAVSKDGYVKFNLTSFEKLTEENRPEDVFKIGKGIKRTRTEFEKYIIKLLLFVESMETAEISSTNHSPAENFTIEKDRWHIISDYKKKRGY